MTNCKISYYYFKNNYWIIDNYFTFGVQISMI